MKTKSHKRTSHASARSRRFFGTQELALLAAVVVALLVFFAWQTNSLPTFLKP
ncbi:hypothetical protein M1403_02500 [Patescibacteria group bacterium]|nr:hypothetical protein [Patescibacteria group bacterium]